MNDGMGPKHKFDVTYDEIVEFLRQLDWPKDALSKRVIRTYYKGDFGISEILVNIRDADICMVIDPVLERPVQAWGDAVITLVEAMSAEIQHVCVGFDQDGDVFIKVTLPHEHLNLERFHCLLLGLCQVAENLVLPLLQANAFDNLKAAA